MKRKRTCENCYHHLVDGCKIKNKSEYLKVKEFCNKHSYINRKCKKLTKKILKKGEKV